VLGIACLVLDKNWWKIKRRMDSWTSNYFNNLFSFSDHYSFQWIISVPTVEELISSFTKTDPGIHLVVTANYDSACSCSMIYKEDRFILVNFSFTLWTEKERQELDILKKLFENTDSVSFINPYFHFFLWIFIVTSTKYWNSCS
jgi:hypothetical protein